MSEETELPMAFARHGIHTPLVSNCHHTRVEAMTVDTCYRSRYD